MEGVGSRGYEFKALQHFPFPLKLTENFSTQTEQFTNSALIHSYGTSSRHSKIAANSIQISLIPKKNPVAIFYIILFYSPHFAFAFVSLKTV